MTLAPRDWQSYFSGMKRFLSISAVALMLSTRALQAQNNTTPLPSSAPSESAPVHSAASIAAKQEAEENYNSLRGQLEELVAAQADQRKRIQELSREVEELKMQLNKPKPEYATSSDLRQLAGTVQEIDKKRQADKDLILDDMKHLAKVVTDAAASRPIVRPTVNSGTMVPRPPASSNQEGYTYTVKKGDYLGLIVQAYRDQGIMVTKKMIIENNPNVNFEKLLTGTKIWFPEPKK